MGPQTTPEGKLTYTLGGSDKSSFAINSTDGQITVKAGTKLDYEGKKVYRVTVTATDPSQASATIDITINVTDSGRTAGDSWGRRNCQRVRRALAEYGIYVQGDRPRKAIGLLVAE